MAGARGAPGAQRGGAAPARVRLEEGKRPPCRFRLHPSNRHDPACLAQGLPAAWRTRWGWARCWASSRAPLRCWAWSTAASPLLASAAVFLCPHSASLSAMPPQITTTVSLQRSVDLSDSSRPHAPPPHARTHARTHARAHTHTPVELVHMQERAREQNRCPIEAILLHCVICFNAMQTHGMAGVEPSPCTTGPSTLQVRLHSCQPTTHLM